MAFLSGKGLLIVPGIDPRPSQEITITAALRVGRELEPRILEVLPAAIIHFPASFTSLNAIPRDLQRVIYAISKDAKEGPAFEGIPYQVMKRWANTALPDKRVVPASERRRMKSFRLHPDAVQKLKTLCKKRGLSESEVLESLLTKA
ncbi:MAG: hypothetical protein J5J00_17065 [Deltaproteobacteria bacterium]|nr:hypothetical protein [Deltaproteobacteria bacterium]